MFSLFGIIFVLVFVTFAFQIFRTAGRIGQIQNRVFDQIERELDQADSSSHHTDDSRPRNYECDQCGATLGDNADVSPSGDFKCTYCGKWSNVHN
ncbi:MAG: hypothetical protein HUJ26_20800 [Planctomycetaceae bacterium]|nr:hypothetical protein [Planctomycetaceae bacterium]